MQVGIARSERGHGACALAMTITAVIVSLIVPVPAEAAASIEAFGSFFVSAFNGYTAGQSDGLNDDPFLQNYSVHEPASAPQQTTTSGEQSGSASALVDQQTAIVRENNVLRSIDSSGDVSLAVSDGATHPDADADTHLEIQFKLPRTKTLRLQGEIAISYCGLEGEQADATFELTRGGLTGSLVAGYEVSASDPGPCVRTLPVNERIEFRADQLYRFFVQATVGGDAATGSSAARWDLALRGETEEDQLECGDEVTTNTVLKTDLSCEGDGLYVGAPGITLDLNGHRISGDGSDTGIVNDNGHDGVTIRNGAVHGFETGIEVIEGDDVTLSDMLIDENTGDGVNMEDSTVSTVRELRVLDNGGNGLSLQCDSCAITNNRARENAGDGIEVFGESLTSGANTIKGNIAVGNDGAGIRLDNANLNTVVANRAAFNEVAGFLIDAADNTFKRNLAENNYGDGYYLTGAPRNTFLANIARSNQRGGFFLTGSSSNTFGPDDRATGNHDHGFLLLTSNGNTLQEVVANGNDKAGIALALSHENTVRKSTTKGNQGTDWSGIHLFGSNENTISQNRRIENNEGFGVRILASDDNDAVGNVATANKQDGIRVDSESERTLLTDNRASTNKVDGIAVYDTSTFGNGNRAANNVGVNCNVILGAPVACAG